MKHSHAASLSALLASSVCAVSARDGTTLPHSTLPQAGW